MQSKGPAIRKRTQIASANRVMFLWVAGVSVIFGISLVAAAFLVQMLFFNERVLQAKVQTISTLDTDNNNVKPLQKNENVLNTNEALLSAKAKPDDQAVQVILDALPSDANSLALGASLQNVLLSGISGLTLDSLQVNPVAGIESLGNNGSVSNNLATLPNSQNQITFQFSVNGDETALTQVLVNLEKSIRTIDVTSLNIESQGATRMMIVQARAYYEPAVNLKLTNEVIK
ncbi:MAG TPA: hypothetical protein VMR16_02610 [Candidatus Saccharimonadales bacterium]|nr:hypothetical protein [Candidatus Saccharimonadales bacterium]